ncbi:MAG TPA: hypothetical protein VKT80_17075 [Chloroflexota bacterium]|nr:hypothetical protein [Chloroflexota bacterium]
MSRRIKYAAMSILAGTIMLHSNDAWSQTASAESAKQPNDREPTGDANASGEQPKEADRVLLAGKVDHGGYGAPHVKVTSVAGQAGLLVGGEGAWIIGHSLFLGGGGYGLATSADAPDLARSPQGTSTLTLGYGGFRIGYVVAPHDLVHFSGALLVGGGGVSVIEHVGNDSRTYRSASMFIVEPELRVEVNITKMLRGGIDASYRYMADSGIVGLSSSKISGPAAGALLAFGWF